MKKTLQNQYQLIKEGKSSKDVFLKEAKTQFPQYVRNAASFTEAVASLKTKGVISENLVSLSPINTSSRKQDDFEIDFKKFLQESKEEAESEKIKADNNKPAESPNIYDREDKKNMDNVLFDQLLTGYYLEMKNPKNVDKTIEEVKEIVFKNLQKDPIFYIKNGQFGLEDIGYTDETPGIKIPKVQDDPSKPYKYETISLNENMDEHQLSTSINISRGTNSGKRFVPTVFPLPSITAKRFGDHLVYNNGTLYVSSILYNNLIKGYDTNLPLKKLIMDLPPMVKQVLNKTESYGGMTQLPKEFKNYFPLKYPVKKSTEDKFNKDRTKQYWSVNDLLIPNPKKLSEEEMTLQEQKLRKIVRAIIKEEISKHPLNENIQKRLKEIEVESTDEVKQAKLSKLQDEIKKRQDQLDMIESNEDLKALTDKKKVKEIEREIKELEKACSKLDKGNKKKEIIDETEEDDALVKQYEEEQADKFAAPNMDDVESGNY